MNDCESDTSAWSAIEFRLILDQGLTGMEGVGSQFDGQLLFHPFF